MTVYNKAEKLTKDLAELKRKGLTIGFVPTMGALHEGHLSLVKKAGNECDVVVVSIFVNPTQFNNPTDLEKYPRTVEKDIELLEETAASVVFVPEVSEIYPNEDSKKMQFDFGQLDKLMEGKHRPGHFNGVAMVVKRLFEIVQPAKAYFGQKDIQQVLIINELINKYLPDSGIEIIKCPIVRESDGLAMSSRNALLNKQQRASAATISKALFEAKEKYKNSTVKEISEFVKERINSETNLSVEYFEIVDGKSLQSIKDWSETNEILACVAVNVTESLRLIDNIYF